MLLYTNTSESSGMETKIANSAGSPWTASEISHAIDSYFSMLKLELAGTKYNKAAANEALRSMLNGRTKASVEFKHQNISAVLLENGWIYIDGYKPMKNVQADLRDKVELRLRFDREIDDLMAHASDFKTSAARSSPTPLRVVEAPSATLGRAEWTPRITGIRRDYVFRDTRNRQLGLAGELAALDFEKDQLQAQGRSDLARRVEHVAVTQGDGLGYDILSFEPNGLEKFIEVKTTLYAVQTPFFVTRNEVQASDFYNDQFHVHRLFHFGKTRKMYSLRGPVTTTCALVPETYIATPRVDTPT